MRRINTVIAAAAVALLALPVSPAAADACQATGAGPLTANYVNEVPATPFDVTCDIGVYLDRPTMLRDVEVAGTTADARSEQYGIYVDGAPVDLRDSTVTTEADYPHQFVSVAYVDGASGTVDGNTITGAHRVGLLARGQGTRVRVRGNDIVGTGPQATGWAENGVQIDQGATGTVTHNTISDHWWDRNDFVSAGLLVFTDEVTASHNVVTGNDLGVALDGDRNNLVHNTIAVSDEATSTLHYGIWVVAGTDNGARHNTVTAAGAPGAQVGIFVAPLGGPANNTKLIRNDVDGWAFDVFDGGSDTKRPAPFDS